MFRESHFFTNFGNDWKFRIFRFQAVERHPAGSFTAFLTKISPYGTLNALLTVYTRKYK